MNKYKKHIVNLCRRHKITLYTEGKFPEFEKIVKDNDSCVIIKGPAGGQSYCFNNERVIAIPELKTESDYFIALHEIAHCLLNCDEAQAHYDYCDRHKKITKAIILDEYKASAKAAKLNKYVERRQFLSYANQNQQGYIEDYNRDWKTELKPVSRYLFPIQ